MRYVALLRAVNVGGCKLPMAELRETCAELGWEKVETWFGGAASGITQDDTEHSVTLTSNNCPGAG